MEIDRKDARKRDRKVGKIYYAHIKAVSGNNNNTPVDERLSFNNAMLCNDKEKNE